MTTGTEEKPVTLEYGRARINWPKASPLRIAIICAATPLIAGFLIFGAWLLTGWGLWYAAGLVTIVVGLLLFGAGLSALIVHSVRGLRDGRGNRRRVLCESLLVTLLLLSHFPAAAYIVSVLSWIEFSYLVSVVNTSGVAVDSFVLTGPGMRVELGPIPPGGRVHHDCRFRGDGALGFTMSQRGAMQTVEEIDGYVTGGLNGDVQITVTAPGTTLSTPVNRAPVRKWLDKS